MICPKCGAETRGKFCDKCGAALEKKEMFSNNQSEAKADTIDKCLEPDKTAVRIINWAQGCVKWGIIIAIANAILGLITSIAAAVSASSVNTSGFLAFIAAFLPVLLQSVIIYAVFYAISLLLSALGKIVQYNKQTSAFVEFQVRKTLSKDEEN